MSNTIVNIPKKDFKYLHSGKRPNSLQNFGLALCEGDEIVCIHWFATQKIANSYRIYYETLYKELPS